uniref:Cytochrome P450 n=1 Tax=Physcomitrium patens TaxID=3218 RepID=A0A7I4D342_PHYPA
MPLSHRDHQGTYRNMGYAPCGPFWHRLKRIVTTQLFSPAVYASHEPIRRKEIHYMLKVLVEDSHKEELMYRTFDSFASIIISDYVPYLSFVTKLQGWGLLNAGTDASANTVEWAMAELMANPDIRKKAQAELDAVVQDRLVQESDIPNLPFLQAIVKENYRMHPSAPLSVRHESHEPCVISGCEFPALTELIMNIFAIHRDPSVYENPDKFDPTRFVRSPEVDPVAGNDFYQLMRFGAGRRMCPGQQLGNTMVTSMLANLLQCFEWETATSERESGGGGGDEVGVDIANHYSFINYRQKPLYLLTKPPRLASLLQPTLAIILFLSTPQQILFSDGFTSSLLSLFLSYLGIVVVVVTVGRI